MEFYKIVIIFFVGLFVSVLSTLVGGSSLLTIPTLILLGLPPHTAIGTDRFGIMGVCLAGWYKFHKKRLINYKVGFSLTIPVMFGSFLGAHLVFEISESVLKLIIIIISVACLFFLVLNPTLGTERTKQEFGKYEYLIGGLMTFVVGVYVGFYGAMGGTLLLYILILWFGQTFLESAGTLKIGAMMMNATAAIVFGLNDAVSYYLAIPMFLGCFIGSYIGAHYSDRIGNVWIRRLFVIVLVILIIKLLI
ncbi:MAG: sulfite exporter TauE/SafE family protein [Desulfobacterales bacterium]|nr:sulfite exporter TauE/SafE family protein [Desulfobacterales bacterium]